MLTWLADRSMVFRGLLDFIYPPLCVGCKGIMDEPGGVCDHCSGRIEWYQEPIALTPVDFRHGGDPTGEGESFPLFAAGDYSDPLREIVIQFKFHGVKSVVPFVAERLAVQFGEKILKLSPAILVPIPLHPSHEYVRGYNQAALLAEAVGEQLDLPIDNSLLVRTKRRRAQARLKREARAANIRDVFEMNSEPPGPGDCENLILVDDVVTSGQTVFEARHTLGEGGYKVVGAIAIAHGL